MNKALFVFVVGTAVTFGTTYCNAQETLSKVDDNAAAITQVSQYTYEQLEKDIVECDLNIAQQDNAVRKYAEQAEEIKAPWIERKIKLLERKAWMDAQNIKPKAVEANTTEVIK